MQLCPWRAFQQLPSHPSWDAPLENGALLRGGEEGGLRQGVPHEQPEAPNMISRMKEGLGTLRRALLSLVAIGPAENSTKDSGKRNRHQIHPLRCFPFLPGTGPVFL